MSALDTATYELAQAKREIFENIEKQAADIQYRLRMGIYATERDYDADECWARLKAAQDAEPWDMVGTFGYLAELQRRGQVRDRDL